MSVSMICKLPDYLKNTMKHPNLQGVYLIKKGVTTLAFQGQTDDGKIGVSFIRRDGSLSNRIFFVDMDKLKPKINEPIFTDDNKLKFASLKLVYFELEAFEVLHYSPYESRFGLVFVNFKNVYCISYITISGLYSSLPPYYLDKLSARMDKHITMRVSGLPSELRTCEHFAFHYPMNRPFKSIFGFNKNIIPRCSWKAMGRVQI